MLAMVTESTAGSPLLAFGPGSRRARWTFVAVAATLATVLVAATVSSWLGARELSGIVNRGHGAMIFQAWLRELPSSGRPSTEALEAFVASHHELGLRWAAVVRGDGTIEVEAGVAAAPMGEPRAAGPDPVRFDGAMRMQIPAIPTGGPGGAGGPPDGKWGPPGGKWGPPGGKGGPPGRAIGLAPPLLGPPPGGPPALRHLVVDFEPVLAAELRQRSQRDLAIGLVGAAGLLLIAGVVSAMSRRAEQTEKRLAEQRHLAALGEMSAVLAHELKNPLASLKGHAQLLQEQLPEGRPRAKANRVVDEAVRLQQLIESLLTFVRSGRIDRAPSDPVAVAKRVVERSRRDGIELRTQGAPATWPLDAMRIEQVLTNLVDNALDASAADSPVELHVSVDGGSLRYQVRDHGEGIPAEIRDTVFAPFKTTKVRGVGLGLAVARRIVEGHGGRIEARDADGGGTVIEVTIPPGDEA